MDHRTAITSWPVEERPREQLFAKGAASLTDATLLSIILRTGSRGRSAVDQARALLSEAGGLQELSRWTAGELGNLVPGTTRVASLLAMFELARRLAAGRSGERRIIRTPEDVAARFGPLLRHLRHEEFWAVLLNSANVVQAEVRITVGTLNASLAHPRECFAEAVQRRAASVVFVHNHPSGNPEPSTEDLALTRQLAASGRILGIPVHDHVIIAGQEFTSLAERGQL
ncbi:MAG: DNA repair protein RadC [Bacteroidetes bacterium]|jgi:DNA repair protein RadC|nr:DNA repair protein RadC [Bacteroidota bacterium]